MLLGVRSCNCVGEVFGGVNDCLSRIVCSCGLVISSDVVQRRPRVGEMKIDIQTKEIKEFIIQVSSDELRILRQVLGNLEEQFLEKVGLVEAKDDKAIAAMYVAINRAYVTDVAIND